MDRYSRKIIGWPMSDRMKESLVIDATQMALFKRSPNANALLHADRDGQYASGNFQRLLTKHGMQCSMGRKGDCWDNSAMENFLHSLKTECTYHEKYLTRNDSKNLFLITSKCFIIVNANTHILAINHRSNMSLYANVRN